MTSLQALIKISRQNILSRCWARQAVVNPQLSVRVCYTVCKQGSTLTAVPRGKWQVATRYFHPD